MNWYFECLSKYAVFSGRARRKEYWMFMLFNLIAALILIIFDGFVLGTSGIIPSVYYLATFLPTISVGVRRLHDIDRSGWWLLIGLIPIVNLVLFVFSVLDSKPGQNRYGMNPKGVTA